MTTTRVAPQAALAGATYHTSTHSAPTGAVRELDLTDVSRPANVGPVESRL